MARRVGFEATSPVDPGVSTNDVRPARSPVLTHAAQPDGSAVTRDLVAAFTVDWPDGRSWLAQAACVDADPELFFEPDGQTPEQALEICRRCSVRAQCLAFALANNVTGVWGGMNAASRRRLKTRLRTRLAREERIDG